MSCKCGSFGHKRTSHSDCPLRGSGAGARKKQTKKLKAAPRRRTHVWVLDDAPAQRVQCACGGSHLPCGTAAGAKSWRAHMQSERHAKYEGW